MQRVLTLTGNTLINGAIDGVRSTRRPICYRIMYAACRWITAVRGTFVAVVALIEVTSNTAAKFTSVGLSADVSVITEGVLGLIGPIRGVFITVTVLTGLRGIR